MEDRVQYLFRKYLNNSCNRAEMDELFDLAEKADPGSPLREQLVAALLESGGANAGADRSPIRFATINAPDSSLPSKMAGSGSLWKSNFWKIAAAAAGLLVGIAAWQYGHSPANSAAAPLSQARPDAQHIHQATARSEYKFVLLPDSSQVWLNADSRLEYPDGFGSGPRHVVLSGEAFFDVKHADKQPFIIHTGTITTTVLGTAFNIRAYPGGEKITVTVKRGKVKVDHGKTQLAILTRGQEMSIDTLQHLVHEKKLAAKEAATWQEGNLSYDDDAFADVVADLQRVYDVRIRITDPAIGRMRISTSFQRSQGIEPALKILCRLTDKTLVKTNDEFIIQ